MVQRMARATRGLAFALSALVALGISAGSAFAQVAADPSVPVCATTPGSLADSYERFNATHDKYPVVRTCHGNGSMHIWAQVTPTIVNGFDYSEQGPMASSFTIWRSWDKHGEWQLIIGRNQPDGTNFVQTWTFDIVNGQPTNMDLAAVTVYDEHLNGKAVFNRGDDTTSISKDLLSVPEMTGIPMPSDAH